jgi:hypothetical protein
MLFEMITKKIRVIIKWCFWCNIAFSITSVSFQENLVLLCIQVNLKHMGIIGK